MVYTIDAKAVGQFDLPALTLYFIDFGSARHLESGPATGVVINDYNSGGGRWDPPEGIDDLDPYKYDICSLGHALEQILQVKLSMRNYLRPKVTHLHTLGRRRSIPCRTKPLPVCSESHGARPRRSSVYRANKERLGNA